MSSDISANIRWVPQADVDMRLNELVNTSALISGLNDVVKVEVPRQNRVQELVRKFGEPKLSIDVKPIEQAEQFLRLAAEIEHQFLVQYLYACYSIDRKASPQVAAWQTKLVQLAREEMGHFLTVQNLFLLIGREP
jgi:hypothetical protein